jgi:hypothetical protein
VCELDQTQEEHRPPVIALLPGTILVDPWGQVSRIERDGTETLLRGGCCGRPAESWRRAA